MLKKERADAKNIRNKIVGVGNTVDSFGDKYQSPYENSRPGSHNNNYSNYQRRTNEEQQSHEPYDPYRPNKKLGQRIGDIIEDVDKIEEGHNAEAIKKKINNGPKKVKTTAESSEPVPDVNFLD